VNPSRILGAVMALAARRPLAVGLVVTGLALGGAALALRLEPNAATDTLVGRSSASFQATERYHQRFGDDAVIILVRGELAKLVLTQDIERLLGLEGCISGNLPAGVTPRGGANGPCGQLARLKPVKVVFGPGTFINEAATQISDEFNREKTQKAQEAQRAADAARRLARSRGMSRQQQARLASEAASLVYTEFVRDIVRLGLRYGLSQAPQLNDPAFVSTLVFDATKRAGTPKARFAYLFPNRNSALVQVRLKPDLSGTERRRAIGLIRQAVRMPDWRLANGETYVVTGVPIVVNDLTHAISHSIAILLIAALIVMALTLSLVFRERLRLLPLGVALVAAALTFGGLSLVGASLTMASIAVLPVLIGLAVDYAIQLQSRVEEERRAGPGGVGVGPGPGGVRGALERVAVRGAPTVATACAATAAGFLVLVTSPVPMVRGFGLLLVVGIAVAFACALTLGTAGLVAPAASGRRLSPAVRALTAWLRPAVHGAGELVRDNRVARRLRATAAGAGSAALRAATRWPARVLGVAVVLAAVGWGVDTQTHVESDIAKLVPQNLGALRDLQALQRSTGVGGEIDVVVSSGRLTDPAVVTWMTDYQAALLKRFGYSAKRPCGQAELCPAFSLPDLFRGGTQGQTQAQISTLLSAVPPYFSQGVITPDHRTATLAFGIRLMPLARQQRVIDQMRSALHPPPGVHAELAGLPVLAAEANAKVSSASRRLLLLVLGLLAVAAVLLVAFRRVERALVPLVPIALATGWSALVLFAIRIPLNPMSVTLGALVIAISTEFSVLLSERYRQERAAGLDPEAALARTYRSTGAAVLASGTTAIAGFAVLVLSDIRMLRDFGFVTVIDLTVSLVGVLVVLPAVLVAAERGELLDLPARALRRAARARPRLRRAEAQ
jgi:hydrophobe/amphiphile efflux-3 (HAE3) family protein